MPSRIRELLTHCSDYCLPTKVTKGQADKVLGLLEKHKLTPSDERALKAYFYDNRETLGDAIDKLDGFKKVKDLRAYIASQVGPADAVLLAFKEAPKRQGSSSAGRKHREEGVFSVRELGDVMDQAREDRTKASRILRLSGYAERLQSRRQGTRCRRSRQGPQLLHRRRVGASLDR